MKKKRRKIPSTIYLIFVLIFAMHQKGRNFRMVRIFCSFILYMVYGILCEIHAGTARGLAGYDPDALFKAGTNFQKGGGLAAGTCAWGLLHVLNTAGTLLVLLVITGCVAPSSVLSTIGSGTVVTMISMFIIAAGLQRTQMVDKLSGLV